MDQNYHASITTSATPEEAFDAVCRVTKWWSKDVTGSSAKLGDEFIVHFGNTFMKFKIIEKVAGQKVIWEVQDCYLQVHQPLEKELHSPLEKEGKDWNGTKVVWEIFAQESGSRIDMTHIGLTPSLTRYDDFKTRWDRYIKNSLYELLTKKTGSPAELQRHVD